MFSPAEGWHTGEHSIEGEFTSIFLTLTDETKIIGKASNLVPPDVPSPIVPTAILGYLLHFLLNHVSTKS